MKEDSSSQRSLAILKGDWLFAGSHSQLELGRPNGQHERHEQLCMHRSCDALARLLRRPSEDYMAGTSIKHTAIAGHALHVPGCRAVAPQR